MTHSQHNTAEETPLANYRMDIRYDGQDYYGWQRHKEKPTIQGALENAVTECFGLRCNVEGSGRTDRGTHALGQVATVRLPKEVDEKKALRSLNKALDDPIEITLLQRVEDNFHARDSAQGKCYCYKIWNHPDLPQAMDGKVWYIPGKLNVKAMQKACPFFVGTMDYASFAKVPNYKRATTIRTVHALNLNRDEDLLTFSIIADGFLYKMVRNIVRALVKVGEGRTPIKELPRIIKAKNRNAAPGTAPASGLYLDSVFYDQDTMNAAVKRNRENKK
ncbi:tRNA pseudouridine38-40 synthase [Desulfocicer vacuolatum DSM 3385]|uniref:tRNA pseudouridine synthase A n=1 Tax=Desulfocicer vacuolatum DSM 3385 TaxID=1121400 RepID=A0A1W2CXK5_9BACT|nr:tRNA pseudouridine(38-40) synthase TruA [Desulfocicer vacuolatum]SMC89995.1 tRNA pseudouridine38-40 synthase [Desulfocicer vacuolatum DSM 3385]